MTRSITRRITIVLFVCCYPTLLEPRKISAQQSSEVAKPTIWHVKEGGLLTIGSDNILYQKKHLTSPLIRAASVTSVCYDTQTSARGPSAWQATKDMGSTSGGEGLILAPLVLPVIAAVHASKSTRHFVTTKWKPEQPPQAGDYEPTLTVEATKGNYRALLQELQQATGRPWTDVSKRRSDFFQRIGGEWKQLPRHQKTDSYLLIRRRSRVGSSVLDPYSYRLELKEGTTGEGSLYLFTGDKKHPELAALIRVITKSERHDLSDAVLVYDETTEQGTVSGLPTATQILMPSFTLGISASQPYEYDQGCPVLP